MWLFPSGQPGAAGAEEPAVPVPAGGEACPAPSAGPIEGCADLFTRLERKLQTEFHSMVQVSRRPPRRRGRRGGGRAAQLRGRPGRGWWSDGQRAGAAEPSPLMAAD